MFRKLVPFVAILLLSGCGIFYSNPGKNDPAAIFIERSVQAEIGWTLSVMVAEIDGKPVSHMGGHGDEWEIRVAPGLRHVVFHVSFRATGQLAEGPSPWHQAYIPLDMTLEAGKRYRLGADSTQQPIVTFTVTDPSSSGAPILEMAVLTRRVKPNVTIVVPGGGFVTIPAKQ